MTLKPSCLARRHFVGAAAITLAGAASSFPRRLIARPSELEINRIVVQPAKGRRLSPVAPNAYAPYRGYDVTEPVLRIRTRQGLEGICHPARGIKPETLQKLIGLDPFKLFRWDAHDRIQSPAPEHELLLTELKGCDVALIDLLGHALKVPASSVLGEKVRDAVQAYDGSVYMEDLLKPEESQNLVFMEGAVPAGPVEKCVRKAQWVVTKRAEGFKALKIKIGRGKWMGSLEAALARDIEVTNAIRKVIGPDAKLLVDGNRGYSERPLMAFDYAQGVAASKVYFMEEMFSEEDVSNMRELKKRLRAAANPVKLAAGESSRGGIVADVYTQRFQAKNHDEPLIDIEQADMNDTGFLVLRSKAAIEAKLGMTCAPHNFGSKLGFYAQVHLGMVTLNWDISEVDDSEFPAFVAEGITVKNGFARLSGAPGLGVALREEHLQKPILEL